MLDLYNGTYNGVHLPEVQGKRKDYFLSLAEAFAEENNLSGLQSLIKKKKGSQELKIFLISEEETYHCREVYFAVFGFEFHLSEEPFKNRKRSSKVLKLTSGESCLDTSNSVTLNTVNVGGCVITSL